MEKIEFEQANDVTNKSYTNYCRICERVFDMIDESEILKTVVPGTKGPDCLYSHFVAYGSNTDKPDNPDRYAVVIEYDRRFKHFLLYIHKIIPSTKLEIYTFGESVSVTLSCNKKTEEDQINNICLYFTRFIDVYIKNQEVKFNV